MEYIRLGKSDLCVSRFCLGCMGFGEAAANDGKVVAGRHSWTLGYDDSKEIIHYALEQGINFFDVAAAYSAGTCEEYVGRILREEINRDQYVIATKFMPRTQEEKDAGINGHDFVLKRLDESLARLGMDHVDIYVMHMWDSHTPMEEIMEGLHSAIVQGKTRYIGMSNCFAYQLAEANAYLKAKGYPQFITMQGHYNLLYREEEREMNRYCHEHGIILTPYSALASGRLARKPDETSKRMQEDRFAMSKYDKTVDLDRVIIERVADLAEKKHVTMTEISLAWLLAKGTVPVVGATKKHHIDGPANAVNITLTEEEIQYLEEAYTAHPVTGTLLMI